MIHIVPWNVLIFAIVWWSGTCYIFVPPKSSILDHRRNSLLYVERSVGQVYQFTGHGAPPEFAKLFRANKISGRVKSKPAGIKRAPAAKVAPIPDLEPFEDLELEVARKYGGNKKRIDGSSSNVRTSNAVRGFEPQQKSDRASQVSSRTPTSREELIRKWEGKGGSAQKVTRSTVTTEGRTSKQAAQVADATRDQPSAQGFRLRPPPPMDPEQLARTKAKEAVAAEKAKLLEQKIKLMREKNKELFKPFHFKDHNNNIANVDQPEQLDSERDDDAATSFEDTESPLFSSTGFEALGISDPGVLRNLEKMQVAMPTQIQALAIPALIRAEQNVILQAQTGSGKTLAYLLPLLSSVDVSIKQVGNFGVFFQPATNFIFSFDLLRLPITIGASADISTFQRTGAADRPGRVGPLRRHAV